MLAEKTIGGMLVLFMLVVVFLATVGRYTKLFNIEWSDEASRYSMIWMCFAVGGLSAYRGEMFAVDIFSDRLSVTGKRILICVRAVTVAAFCLFAVIYGTRLVQHQIKIGQVSPSMNIPMGVMYGSVPIGCLLIMVQYAIHSAEQFIAAGGSKKNSEVE